MVARHENPQRRGRRELLAQNGFTPSAIIGFKPVRVEVIPQQHDRGPLLRNRPAPDCGKGGIVRHRLPGVSDQDDSIRDLFAGRDRIQREISPDVRLVVGTVVLPSQVPRPATCYEQRQEQNDP